MPGAIIAIDQDRPGPSVSAGTPGIARKDLWLNNTVRPRCTETNGSYVWSLLAKPVGSSATLVDPNAQECSFDPDVAGSYRLQLEVDGGGPGKVQILIAAVTKDNTGTNVNRNWRYPALGEKPGENNWGGNARSYVEALEAILDDIRTNLGGGVEPGTDGHALVTAEEAARWVPFGSRNPDNLEWWGSWGPGYVESEEWDGRQSSANAVPTADPTVAIVTVGDDAYDVPELDGSTQFFTAVGTLGDYINATTGECSGIIAYDASATNGYTYPGLIGSEDNNWWVGYGENGRLSFFIDDGTTEKQARTEAVGTAGVALFRYDGKYAEVSGDLGATWARVEVVWNAGHIAAGSKDMYLGQSDAAIDAFFAGKLPDVRICGVAYSRAALAAAGARVAAKYGYPTSSFVFGSQAIRDPQLSGVVEYQAGARIVYRGLKFRIWSVTGEQNNYTSVSATTLAEFTMADETHCAFFAEVTCARVTNVTKAGTYTIKGSYRRTGGTGPQLVGATPVPTSEDETGGTLELSISGNIVRVRFIPADTEARNISCELRVKEQLST